MATPETLTRDLYERRLSLQDRVVARATTLWGQMPFADLDAGWGQLGPVLTSLVTDGQLASATLSTPYIDDLTDYYGFTGQPAATDRRLYAGVAPDGRELEPLLYGAVTSTKTAVGLGMGGEAMLSGMAFLAAAIKSAMVDVAGQADQSLIAGRGYKSYVRAVSPNACSRCAILSGIYSAATAFQRHPNCQCIAVPVPNLKTASKVGFATSPYEYFEGLSPAEQNRVFTNAGAKAIREGADIWQVVNARRGAKGIAYGTHNYTPRPNSGNRLQKTTIGRRPDGGPLEVYLTGEGGTRRGRYNRLESERRANGQRSTTIRLMPEQIFRMAGDDPVRARQLLIRYGYIFE